MTGYWLLFFSCSLFVIYLFITIHCFKQCLLLMQETETVLWNEKPVLGIGAGFLACFTDARGGTAPSFAVGPTPSFVAMQGTHDASL